MNNKPTTEQRITAFELSKSNVEKLHYVYQIWRIEDIGQIRGHNLDHLWIGEIERRFETRWYFRRDKLQFVVVTYDETISMKEARYFAQCVIDGRVIVQTVVLP